MKIKLNPFVVKTYSQNLIDKFKSDDNMLKHARFDKKAGTRGYFFIDRKYGKLVGYIAFEKNMIIALEVTEDYQGSGYAKKLLRFAESHGANELTVNKNNTNAIEMYKHLGWKKKKDLGKMILMRKKPV